MIPFIFLDEISDVVERNGRVSPIAQNLVVSIFYDVLALRTYIIYIIIQSSVPSHLPDFIRVNLAAISFLDLITTLLQLIFQFLYFFVFDLLLPNLILLGVALYILHMAVLYLNNLVFNLSLIVGILGVLHVYSIISFALDTVDLLLMMIIISLLMLSLYALFMLVLGFSLAIDLIAVADVVSEDPHLWDLRYDLLLDLVLFIISLLCVGLNMQDRLLGDLDLAPLLEPVIGQILLVNEG